MAARRPCALGTMSTEKSGWSRLSHNAYRESLVGKRCSGYTELTTGIALKW